MSPTAQLVEYIVGARTRALPDTALESAKHHFVDTLASIVSGSRLMPGQRGAEYARARCQSGPAVVIADGDGASEEFAALANAMAAHADETDDTHELSKSHPGSSIVSTALAVAQANGRNGTEMLRAIALGYDVGPRVNMSLWTDFAEIRKQRRGTPTISGMFGSAAAAASLTELDETHVRYLLSYVAQQVSGMNSWKRDQDHIEKAWVIAGWPAYGALLALSLVCTGWTGVDDVFAGDPNFIDIVGDSPDPAQLIAELGTRFEVQRTHIKVHSVGSPAQAPVQALQSLIRQHELTDHQVAAVTVRLPAVLAHTVQRSRKMANINLQYLMSVTLADGGLNFAAAHDDERFARWDADGGDQRIQVIAEESWAPRRQAVVEVTTVGGRQLDCRVDPVRGAPDNPMSEAEVAEKAVGLMGPVLGDGRAAEVVKAAFDVDSDGGLDRLTALLGRTN